MLKIKKIAKDKYDLILNIVEANALSDISTIYSELSSYLIETSKLDTLSYKSDFFGTAKARAFYDLMSFGSSTDIKYSIIKSYVLNYLIDKEFSDKETLLQDLNQYFESNIDSDYLTNFLQKLSSERKITNKVDKIYLTKIEKERLQDVISEYKREEVQILSEIQRILGNYEIEINIENLLPKIIELYESNYSINLEEFTNRESSYKDLKSATSSLVDFISVESGKDKEISEKIVKEIVEAADKVEIISKIAIGRTYSKVSDPQRLQNYIRQNINNKKIFLDANVLIYIVLVHYDEEILQEKLQLQIAKQFMNFAKSNNLLLKTIHWYIIEVGYIFKEALDLIPFTRLDIVDYLGLPSNIIYQYYIFLRNSKYFKNEGHSFEDFLKEFKFYYNPNKEFESIGQMEYLLSSIGIEIEDIQEYDIAKTLEIIIDDLDNLNKTKSNYATKNDARMFNRLGDKNVEVNPFEPIFCTSDLTLFSARKKYFEFFPSCTQWFLFTPSRLMDHFAMMKFQVKLGSVSTELLSLLDQDFAFQKQTQSLIDSILVIINPNTETGLRYTNKLAELRKTEILEIDRKVENTQEFDFEGNSVDRILAILLAYFFVKENKWKDAFKELFNKEEYIESFVTIVSDEKKYLKEHGEVSDSLISKMTIMIKDSDSNK